MSFDINWNQLTIDDTINQSIKEFLDQQFKKISLPSFISNLSVTDFNLGEIPPEITIRHIGDPFEEFYEDEDNLGATNETNHNLNDERSTMGKSQENGIHKDNAYNSQNFDDDDDDDEGVDEDDDDDEYDDHDLGTINEGISLLNFNDSSTTPSGNSFGGSIAPLPPPPLNPSRDSFHSILHPYGVNSIIGATGAGSETPTNILNQNYLSSRVLPKISVKQKQPHHDDNDIQLIVEINYKGDMHINLLVNLLVNYPSPNFISLPIKLHITDIVIHSIATIAYLKKSVYLSFLCDVDDAFPDFDSNNNAQTPTSTTGGNFVDYYSNDAAINKERIDIVKKIKIESEIGEVENNILRNVGKVEKFLVEQLRNILRDEIAWPSWICIDMNDDGDDDDDDEVEDSNVSDGDGKDNDGKHGDGPTHEV
ncbi:mitochondrial inheritance complex (MDM12/MDM10/MMM1) subunit, putative [Candida dubliniensis CD36]|uniref:Mitochondrial distribution and morphology protein 12 n=1 Tax=Candida dubliniensis (strain CD36 / ATCC MYA-646 / CBS 7987 / NCPF 3949 / NRRL Y-17841) TaxID=573826 RepID=MDM12_CANDC|nr:mitochondrial inheritance complex (MDM12/MDM10/MMM1) subunit, putative [Candida dubliniensis CD36]B9WK07.1 RecName: Full=Mitochondrial distribution and morphology protein 12; AltName: Full=Mitochondrial inheritance component MDM12 [Candida dubliniensis CD36]CAX40658.1 mitochondrial inheritance complex (MDM12/MDM10/MMM1) subunit, putative [Candida dubliniensis CD36]